MGRDDRAPGIAQAALPSERYLTAEAFEQDRELVFGGGWQLAAFSPDVAVPRSYATARLGATEVLLTRDGYGELRAFHNVCQHRGALLAEGMGRGSTLSCPYHAWTYDLDGSLRRAPGMDSIDTSRIRLCELRVAERPPFVFVHPGPAAPDLDEAFGELFDSISALGIDMARLAAEGLREVREWEMAANWKVVVENSLECYHCAVAHPSLRRSLDLRRYEHRLGEWWSLQGAPTRTDGGSEISVSRFGFLYPNMFLEVYPGAESFATIQVLPLAPDRTLSIHTKFFLGSTSGAERAEWDEFIAPVIDEDIALCESVQRGLASGGLDRGRLNVHGAGANEVCNGHFVALVERALEVSA
jgi:phenylpropionate dioxygenase-like ring-hydroxylating dioxygenase large terminal subunit